MRRFRIFALPLLLCATGLAPAAPTESQPTPVAAEAASANFPLSLRGFFGQGDTAEASLLQRETGKARWVKPGDTFGGWKLETISTRTGSATLSAGSRRVTLHLAGESGGAATAPPVRKYTKHTDSITLRRAVMAHRKYPGLAAAMRDCNDRALDVIAVAHPELISPETGKVEPGSIEKPNPALDRAMEEPEMKKLLINEHRRLFWESTDPGILAIRAGELAFLDANERIQPRDDDGADLPASTPEERKRNKETAHHLRVMEEADRLYLSRGGDPDTGEFDKMMQERDAQRKAEAESEAKDPAE